VFGWPLFAGNAASGIGDQCSALAAPQSPRARSIALCSAYVLRRAWLSAVNAIDHRSAGTEDGAIADEIGMSVKMVSRYLRFADKAASARASRDRRE
jgi:hypothetical protein